jgi:alpha-amylase/alpha-mannosidase (GH57 family)
LDRFICVHGHFYQPPRENPWLEVVERQEDAYPFHDWNERIAAECYSPNTRARILDGDGRIIRLMNNYAWLSFNMGPTLLAWLEDAAPAAYAAVLDADVRSAQRFGGHGSAMAQVYGHAIMPLTGSRDRRTQVRWGVIDFEHRFGRAPEGMWLAETAVDDDTLEQLADAGIRFTVLSPYQAARVKPIGEDGWRDVAGGQVDPTQPYRVTLPSGRTIAVFFYDGPISQAIAFEGLLASSERFEQRLLEGFGDRDGPQLVNVATDGESYGHHHRHGEMGLAATFDRLAARDDVQVTNYAQHLSRFPPTAEAEIVQASSWSCAHGVERWRADCGCGSESDRHQRWRAPLRAALDELRDAVATRFETLASELLVDPWAAREDYLEVVLDREGQLGRFLARHATRPLDADATSRSVQLLELQRHALLMYTSCGWFFDELCRPEPVQVLRYAARAIQLTHELTGDDLEPAFLAALADAESNDPAYGDGRQVYEQLVRPAIADLDQVGAHFAISGLVRDYGDRERVGAFEVVRDDHHHYAAGRVQLHVGRLTVRSVVTLVERRLEFAVLHLGDHTFTCGLRPRGDDEDYRRLFADVTSRFDTADVPGVIRAIDRHLGAPQYSLRSLFRDERQRILDTVLATTLEEVEVSYRAIFRSRAPLMRFLTDVGATVPTALRSSAEVVINAELRRELATTALQPDDVRSLLDEAARFGVELDVAGLSHTISGTIARMAGRVRAGLDDVEERLARFDEVHVGLIARAETLLEVVETLPFEVDLRPAQDVLWWALQTHQVDLATRAQAGDDIALRWLGALEHLADAIGVVPPAVTTITDPTGAR